MPTRTPRRFAVLSVAALALAACGGGSSSPAATGPVTTVAQADADELLGMMLNFAASAIPDAAPGARAVSALPGIFPAVAINATVPCAVAGQVAVTGTNDTTATLVTANITTAFTGCQDNTGTSGKTWTFDGTITTNITETRATGAQAGTAAGSVTVNDGTTTATCAISLTLTRATASGTVTGTLCGKTVSVNITGTPFSLTQAEVLDLFTAMDNVSGLLSNLTNTAVAGSLVKASSACPSGGTYAIGAGSQKLTNLGINSMVLNPSYVGCRAKSSAGSATTWTFTGRASVTGTSTTAAGPQVIFIGNLLLNNGSKNGACYISATYTAPPGGLVTVRGLVCNNSVTYTY